MNFFHTITVVEVEPSQYFVSFDGGTNESFGFRCAIIRSKPVCYQKNRPPYFEVPNKNAAGFAVQISEDCTRHQLPVQSLSICFQSGCNGWSAEYNQLELIHSHSHSLEETWYETCCSQSIYLWADSNHVRAAGVNRKERWMWKSLVIRLSDCLDLI